MLLKYPCNWLLFLKLIKGKVFGLSLKPREGLRVVPQGWAGGYFYSVPLVVCVDFCLRLARNLVF